MGTGRPAGAPAARRPAVVNSRRVPRIEFWFTDHDAIRWTFDLEPLIGEEVVLGDRGVFRVLYRRDDPVPGADVAFDCERVRDASYDDLKEMTRRGVDRLPPLV